MKMTMQVKFVFFNNNYYNIIIMNLKNLIVYLLNIHVILNELKE